MSEKSRNKPNINEKSEKRNDNSDNNINLQNLDSTNHDSENKSDDHDVIIPSPEQFLKLSPEMTSEHNTLLKSEEPILATINSKSDKKLIINNPNSKNQKGEETKLQLNPQKTDIIDSDKNPLSQNYLKTSIIELEKKMDNLSEREGEARGSLRIHKVKNFIKSALISGFFAICFVIGEQQKQPLLPFIPSVYVPFLIIILFIILYFFSNLIDQLIQKKRKLKVLLLNIMNWNFNIIK